VSVVGNTVNLASPIPLDFKASLNVKTYPMDGDGCTTLCGLEDLTIQNSPDPIRFFYADRCWFKDIEIANCSGGDNGYLALYTSFQCEVRGCYIHDAYGYPTMADGQGATFNFGTCNSLFVDNIGNRIGALCQINGAAANAFLYNYTKDIARAASTNQWVGTSFVHHGPHGMMNIFEGNIISRYQNDGYHGSTSHGTLFRNHINGLSNTYTEERRLVDLCRGSYYHNAVGNVIGDISYSLNIYDTGYAGHAQSVAYLLGWPDMGSVGLTPPTPWSTYPGTYPDPRVGSTMIRHGNYDYYHRTVIWDSNIPSRTIPDSLFYTSKPDFFGTLQWPPIGPDVIGMVNTIPAKSRWDAYVSSGNIGELFRHF
jgi:hypothetical protein